MRISVEQRMVFFMIQTIIKFTVLPALVVSILFAFDSTKIIAQNNDDYSKEESYRLLLEASEWTLINGLYIYKNNGFEKLKSKLLYDYRISRPIVYDDYETNNGWFFTFISIASIPTDANHAIRRLYKEEINGVYYEFWINVVTALDDSLESPRQVFFITTTDDQYGVRDIIRESDQVILSHTVSATDNSESIEIKLPLTDDVLYQMEAWEYPTHYRGTNIPSLLDTNL